MEWVFLHAPTPAQISKKERPCPVHADWLILLSSKERVVTAVSGASRAGVHGGSAIWKADAVTEIKCPVGHSFCANDLFVTPPEYWCYECEALFRIGKPVVDARSIFHPEKPTHHQSVHPLDGVGGGWWQCNHCGAGGKTLEYLNMVACDLGGIGVEVNENPRATRIHTGEAKWLCETGAGHVCDEPESRFEQLLAQMKELHDKKKADYTGTSGDLIWNYRNSAKLAGITTAQGMFARLCEKVIRISSVLSNGGATQVTDEKLTDTYFDLAVISLLCIIESEER